jgi:chromosome segregation ATPase
MDQKQVEKRLEWLDEQRIKDSEQLQALVDRNKYLEESIEKLDRKFLALSDETSRTAALATRINRMDDALSKHRNEISRQLQDVEERRTEKEKHLKSLRKTDQKGFSKRLDDVRKELLRLEKYEQLLDDRREEELRINIEINSIKNQLESMVEERNTEKRKAVSLSENQKQVGKRLTKIENHNERQKKGLDGVKARVESLESLSRRLEVRANEFQVSEKERFETQELWMESQGLKSVEFEKSWKEWGQRYSDFEKRAETIDQRMIAYEETHRILRQMQSDLDDVIERLERRITEVGEMQRLAEDRVKHSWGEFQSEDHRRWSTHTLTLDERWNEHTRLHDKLRSDTDEISSNLTDGLDRLVEIEGSDRRRLAELLSTLREWMTELDSRGR